MSYEVLMLSVGCVVVAISLFVLNILNKKRLNANQQEDIQRPRGVPAARGPAGDAPRRAGRNVRTRMRLAAARQEEENDDDEEEADYDPLADEIAMPDCKIGTKKRKKLEMKAEKRMQRERELEEREERKERQKQIEERQKREDEKAKEEEKRKEDEEKALKEEQEKRELEAYLKLKESFEVEEEGYDEEDNTEETNKYQEFIKYIKEEKVVLLEDLATRFKLKTQDAIDRLQTLLADETLIGVIDDRGKFISITREELESVASFIRQNGRVSIAELAECSNSLINLQPESMSVSS